VNEGPLRDTEDPANLAFVEQLQRGFIPAEVRCLLVEEAVLCTVYTLPPVCLFFSRSLSLSLSLSSHVNKIFLCALRSQIAKSRQEQGLNAQLNVNIADKRSENYR
jgi:hypothetical protein